MNIRRLVGSTVISGALLAGAPAAAFAAAHPNSVKAGSACTKAQKGKTTKVGTKTYVCKLVSGKYKWEVK